MLKNFRTIFTPQELSDREAQATFRVLNAVLVVTLLGVSAALATVFAFSATLNARVMVSAMAILLLISFILLRRRILTPARIMAPLSLYVTITFLMATGIGLHDISIIAYGGIVILASLTLGKRGALTFAALGAAAILIVGVAELTGALVTAATFLTVPGDPVLISIVILALAYMQVILINQLNLNVEEARKHGKAQAEANLELTELKNAVEARSAEFEYTSQLNARRAAQFKAIAQIAHSTTGLKELGALLSDITESISKQFGYYHIGIFFLDESLEYAVLAASNSPGGKRMLEKGFRLRVGEAGIVETVAASGAPRIALDTGADPVFFDNPDLPETHSEIAVPLKSGGRVIGVLDLQSAEPSAFTNEDIASLSILADQASIAIENTRLYEASRTSLEQTETAYRQYVQQQWSRLTREEKLKGYRFASGASAPLQEPLDLGESARVSEAGKIYQREGAQNNGTAVLAIPVKLRGEVIGILRISTSQKPRWTDNDIDIAEAVAERLALSMENARLFQSSANRATRERIVSDISSKISGNIRTENILQTTAQELSQALGGSDVLIQMQAPKQAPEEQA